MKFFRKLALAALLTVLLTGTCLARETFHGAYLQGFPDGSIRPDAAVTRAELAEILYRMMEPEQRRGAYLHGKCISGCLCAALGV